MRETVVRSQLEAAGTHLVVVPKIGTTFALPPGGDILGEDAGEPQAEIPQVRTQEQATTAVCRGDVGDDLSQVAVDFIIVVGDAYRAIAETELEHERPEIVAEACIIDPGIAQSVANGHVDVERR